MINILQGITRRATVLGVLSVCMAFAASARADPYTVAFDLQGADLAYAEANHRLTVSTGTGSSLSIELQDPSGNAVDHANMWSCITPFNFTLTLDMASNGQEMWSATGSLLISDQTTTTNAVEAHFRSTSILIKDGSGYTLNIDGILSPLSGESILVNRGDPWRFAGDGEVYHVTFPTVFDFRPTPASPDADGTAGQITVAQSRSYGNGDLFVIKVNVPVGTLDDLFSIDRSMTGGEVKGSIVPAPAAVVLGLVGLAAVGWYRRRLA